MSDIKIYKYNNYFNRIVKKEDTLAGYGTAIYSESNTNFVPGNDSFTVKIAGKGDYNGTGDYLIEHSGNTILSRWFIIESTRTRRGQYELQLKRDVLADNYNAVITAPMYVEKATITDPSDPQLFNKESLDVNQIKQEEIPLKDETECGWVVGYVAHNYEPADPVETKAALSATPDITVAGLSSWSYWNSVESNTSFTYKSSQQSDNIVRIKVKWGFIDYGGTDVDDNAMLSTISLTPTNYLGTNVIKDEYMEPGQTYPSWWNDYGISRPWLRGHYDDLPASEAQAFANALFGDEFRQKVNNNLGGTGSVTVVSESELTALRNLSNKTILDSTTNTLYSIEIIELSNTSPLAITNATVPGSALLTYINGKIASPFSGTCTNNDVTIELGSPAYAIKLNQVTIKCEATISSVATRYHLEDSPFDMFCIPFSDDISLYDGTDTFKCSKSVALAMGVAIMETQSQTAIYDLQLLPYCPARHVIAASTIPNSVLDISKGSYDIIYDTADTPNKLSAIIWCTKSTFKVDIDQKLELPRHLNLTITDPNVGQDQYLKTNVPLLVNDINVDGDWDKGAALGNYNITSITHSVKSDNMLVKYINKATNNIVNQYYACSINLYCADDSTYNNVLSIKDKNEIVKASWSVNQFNALDYYIVVEFETNEVGAKGLGHDYPWPAVMKYVYFHYSDPTALDIKINNECNMYRLCSPNYAGAFDFSVAKSRGVDGFIAECTYKAFNPYIHVLPKLKGLYGENFVSIDDTRGLLCSGDFSLTQLSNAWANYELQNKNYEAMFNRQIENLDVNNSIAKTQAFFNLFSGTVQGSASGLATGAMMSGGNPYAAAAGAAVGGVASAIGGIADYALLGKQQAENRDFTIDMHEYSLQNIQAIPSTVTKTSALVYNTRIWPFVEVYTCTEKERTAYINLLKYKGMSVLRIGSIEEFKVAGEYNFTKGQIIRLLLEDNMMSQEVYNEINKGVFI